MKKKYFLRLAFLLSIFILFHQQLSVKAEELENKTVIANPGDTSTELQVLLDYNKNGKYNLTVEIPEGSYDLNKELRIYSNTTIKADVKAQLLKKHQKGPILSNDLSKDEGGYTTSENITINGGIWDSAPIMKNKGTESFRFIHATNVTVKNATVCNVPENSHLITFAGVKNGRVDNCILYGYNGTAGKEAIQIDIVHDNVIVPSNQSSLIKYDDLACNGITINNCEIYDYPRAIGSHTSVKGVFHKNITITNNNLHDIREAAIKAYNYVNLEVSNNTIDKAACGVLVYTHIGNEKNHYLAPLATTKREALPKDYNIVIKDNTITNMKDVISSSGSVSYGEAIRTMGCATRPLTGVTIENNTITGTERYGIFQITTPYGKVINNNISNTSNSGIFLISNSSYSEIRGNILTKSGDNLYPDAGGIGLSAATDAIVTDNTITNAKKNGIYLMDESTTCTISNNTITTVGNNAIALYEDSNEATITDNIIKDYKLRGISTDGIDSALISLNEIYGTADKSKDGIFITGLKDSKNSFRITNNYIKTTSRYGIYISTAPNSYVSANTIINIGQNAIYLGKGSDGSRIYDNYIETAKTAGSQNKSIETSNSKKVLMYGNDVN